MIGTLKLATTMFALALSAGGAFAVAESQTAQPMNAADATLDAHEATAVSEAIASTIDGSQASGFQLRHASVEGTYASFEYTRGTLGLQHYAAKGADLLAGIEAVQDNDTMASFEADRFVVTAPGYELVAYDDENNTVLLRTASASVIRIEPADGIEAKPLDEGGLSLSGNGLIGRLESSDGANATVDEAGRAWICLGPGAELRLSVESAPDDQPGPDEQGPSNDDGSDVQTETPSEPSGESAVVHLTMDADGMLLHLAPQGESGRTVDLHVARGVFGEKMPRNVVLVIDGDWDAFFGPQ
jgi:hypothetical protein